MIISREIYDKIAQNFYDSVEEIPENLIADFYVRFPHETKDVFGKKSIFIEGERGTGKSMLLRMVLNDFKENDFNKENPWICKLLNFEDEKRI